MSSTSCRFVTVALALSWALTPSSVMASTKLPNTGLVITKAAHEAGKLVIKGRTKRRGQVVKLDFPAKKSKKTRASRLFKIVVPMQQGDCEIILSVGKKKDLMPVSGCGLVGPAGPAGAQGPAGVAGNDGAQGPAGPQGPAGVAGNDGAQGSAGIVKAGTFQGPGGLIPANGTGYLFVGPQATLTNVVAGQRLIASASVPLLAGGTTQQLRFGICYQLGNAAPVNFALGNFQYVSLPSNQSAMLANSSSMVAGSDGAYKIGACAHNFTSAILTFEWVNGWVFATN